MSHVSPCLFGGVDEGRLHGRVKEGELRGLLWRADRQISMGNLLWPKKHVEPRQFVPTRLVEAVIETKLSQLGHTPRMHLLAAHSVFERRLSFQDQDLDPMLSQSFRKACPCQPAANRDHVVGHQSPSLLPSP